MVGHAYSLGFHFHGTLLEWILGTQGVKVWIGFMLLRTGTSGGLLWTR